MLELFLRTTFFSFVPLLLKTENKFIYKIYFEITVSLFNTYHMILLPGLIGRDWLEKTRYVLEENSMRWQCKKHSTLCYRIFLQSSPHVNISSGNGWNFINLCLGWYLQQNCCEILGVNFCGKIFSTEFGVHCVITDPFCSISLLHFRIVAWSLRAWQHLIFP